MAELAGGQHGVVATWQLAIDENGIQYRARTGRLHRIHRGVYAVGHRKLACEGHWMAAVLSYGPEAVLSHRTAAALWGIGTNDWKIHITTPRSKRSGFNANPAAVLADIVALANV